MFRGFLELCRFIFILHSRESRFIGFIRFSIKLYKQKWVYRRTQIVHALLQIGFRYVKKEIFSVPFSQWPFYFNIQIKNTMLKVKLITLDKW